MRFISPIFLRNQSRVSTLNIPNLKADKSEQLIGGRLISVIKLKLIIVVFSEMKTLKTTIIN